jgi:uncharacterized protein YjdB
MKTDPAMPFALALGQKATIKAVYMPINAKVNLNWESLNTARVIVNQNGVVTAVGTGAAVIKVTDTVSGLYASVMITVVP